MLSRLHSKARDIKEVPESYHSFLQSTLVNPGRRKEREPTHMLMARIALSDDVGLFKLLLNLLTSSPVFVTAVAWRAGSTVTDPNVIAFHSVIKGEYFLDGRRYN